MIYTWSTKLKQSEAKHIVAEAKLNHDTEFYRIKDGGGVPSPLPPPPPHHQELMKFYESCSQGDLHLLFCKVVHRLQFCLDFTSLRRL